MEPLQFLVPLGPLAAAETALAYVVLALVLANLVTRLLAHRSHVAQVDRDETPTRYLPHVASSVALLLASLAYLVAAPHGGMVLSVLVVATLLADLFEFESRQVEARNGLPVERPKSALTGSLLVLLYAGYQSVFFVVQPVWSALV
jgi:hypothetical protein